MKAQYFIVTALLITGLQLSQAQITTSGVTIEDNGGVTLIGGNVGIGTSDISTKLTIHSSDTKFITFKRASNLKNAHVGYGAANEGGIYLGTDDNQYALWVQQNGNVGIGTYDPSTKLTIHSSDTKFITFERTGNLKNAHIGYGAANEGGIYIGTDDNQYTLWIQQNGNVGIGTANPNHELEVNGHVHGTTFSADSPPSWPDYVFHDDYQLPKLTEVESYIKEKGHLKDIPSEKEVLKNGIDLTDMDAKLLQKIEELTLYLIQQNKELKSQKTEIEKLKKLLESK